MTKAMIPNIPLEVPAMFRLRFALLSTLALFAATAGNAAAQSAYPKA